MTEQFTPPPEDADRDALWELLEHLPTQILGIPLYQKALEFVQQHYDAAYWQAVREEAEAFWEKRYDPAAKEDWS